MDNKSDLLPKGEEGRMVYYQFKLLDYKLNYLNKEYENLREDFKLFTNKLETLKKLYTSKIQALEAFHRHCKIHDLPEDILELKEGFEKRIQTNCDKLKEIEDDIKRYKKKYSIISFFLDNPKILIITLLGIIFLLKLKGILEVIFKIIEQS